MTYVLFDSWAGRTKARVTVLKVCRKRTKVRFEQAAFGRPIGHVQYVPNHAIDNSEVCRRCGYPLDSAGHMNGCAE